MQAVESLVNLAVSAGNTAISAYFMKAEVAKTGLNAFASKAGKAGTAARASSRVKVPRAGPTSNPQGFTTLPNKASLTDPAILEAPKTLALANAINMLLVGGKDGNPDWENIRATGTVRFSSPVSRLFSRCLYTQEQEWSQLCQVQPREAEESPQLLQAGLKPTQLPYWHRSHHRQRHDRRRWLGPVGHA
jgi:hypothetical protein